MSYGHKVLSLRKICHQIYRRLLSTCNKKELLIRYPFQYWKIYPNLAPHTINPTSNKRYSTIHPSYLRSLSNVDTSLNSPPILRPSKNIHQDPRCSTFNDVSNESVTTVFRPDGDVPGTSAFALDHERRVREVEGLDRPGTAGRRRLSRIRRGEGRRRGRVAA